MAKIVKFGDVFLFRGEEYVFLAVVDEWLYAAKILSEMHAEQINKLYERRNSQGPIARRKADENILFCFVMLHTEQFLSRMVHFKSATSGLVSGNDGLTIEPNAELGIEDLKEIKKVIIEGPLPIILKEVVKGIEI